jgi:hypothetical protein
LLAGYRRKGGNQKRCEGEPRIFKINQNEVLKEIFLKTFGSPSHPF